MNEEYFKAINEIKETKSASNLIINAFKELKPNKKNICSSLIILTISLVLSCIIGTSENTLQIIEKSASTLLGIQIGLFGCIFTIYSIFFAFMSDGYMQRLSRIKYDEDKSLLLKTISYFESVLFIFFIGIALSGLILLFVNSIQVNFRLTNCLVIDNSIASLLIFIYYTFTIRVIFELKCTIYNTILLFRTSLSFRFMDFPDSSDQSNK